MKQVLRRRIRGAKRLPETCKFVPMLRRLGGRYMSISIPNEQGGFDIVEPDWRSRGAHTFLSTFDHIDLSRRFDGMNQPTRGNWVAERRYTGRTVSTLPPPKGLPVNAYDPSWLDRQPGSTLQRLQVNETQFPFKHSKETLACVFNSFASSTAIH